MMQWVRNFVFSANLLHFHSWNQMNFFRFFWILELVENGLNRFCCNTFAPLKNDLPSSSSSACQGEQLQPQIKYGNGLCTYQQSFFQKRPNRFHLPLMRYSLNHFFPKPCCNTFAHQCMCVNISKSHPTTRRLSS
jgi:hypothetical protein